MSWMKKNADDAKRAAEADYAIIGPDGYIEVLPPGCRLIPMAEAERAVEALDLPVLNALKAQGIHWISLPPHLKRELYRRAFSEQETSTCP